MERNVIERRKIEVPAIGDVLTRRPNNMPYEQYRKERSWQQEKIKARLREGIVIHKSWEWNNYHLPKEERTLSRNRVPFRAGDAPKVVIIN